MSSSTPLPERYYEDLVRRVIEGRRWIVAFGASVSSASFCDTFLRRMGATDFLALGASRGVGVMPEAVETITLNLSSDNMMAEIRSAEAMFNDLPLDIVSRIDAFDPDGQARAIREIFSGGAPIAGRRTYGARHPSWVALEDKMIVDAFWDNAGVTRAPVRIVAAQPAALARASEALDQGMGTVWVGDNRSGWHGGATFLRWVRSDEDAAEAQAYLAGFCDRVRVMPFLEGIPCSIHGVVFSDAVIALRPCEMLVFRKPDSNQFIYGAAGTFWDPPAADRAVMRDVARRVGAHLRRTVGYRGVFTVDGVMTRDGFLPTELNPRFGAAINVMTRQIPGLPMYPLHMAIIEDEPFDWRPANLEALILSHADAHRNGRVGLAIPRFPGEVNRTPLCFDGARCRFAEDDEPDAFLSIGPTSYGGRIHLHFCADRTPIGPPLAPRAAAALNFADAHYGLGLGPLEPAPDVRGHIA